MLKFLASLIAADKQIEIAFKIAKQSIKKLKNEQLRETLLQLLDFLEPIVTSAVLGREAAAELQFSNKAALLAQSGLAAQLQILENQNKRGFEVADKIVALHKVAQNIDADGAAHTPLARIISKKKMS